MEHAPTGAPDDLIILSRPIGLRGHYWTARIERHGATVRVTDVSAAGQAFPTRTATASSRARARRTVAAVVDTYTGDGFTVADLGGEPEPWDIPDPLAADAPIPF